MNIDEQILLKSKTWKKSWKLLLVYKKKKNGTNVCVRGGGGIQDSQNFPIIRHDEQILLKSKK